MLELLTKLREVPFMSIKGKGRGTRRARYVGSKGFRVGPLPPYPMQSGSSADPVLLAFMEASLHGGIDSTVIDRWGLT